MSLPSKWAPSGLDPRDKKKTITVGSARPKRPVNYTIKTIEDRIDRAVQHASQNLDLQDVEMVPMDGPEVDVISDFIHQSRVTLQYDQEFEIDLDHLASPSIPNISYLIIDTNFLLSHLKILDELKNIGKLYGIVMIIPATVVQELDGLKTSENSAVDTNKLSTQSVSHLARWANDWIYSALAEPQLTVRGQKLDEKIDKFASKDNAIFDCCIYFQKHHQPSLQVLLSNDKNLCAKALANDVLTVSYRPEMTAELIASTIHNENIARFGDLTTTSTLKQVKPLEPVISDVPTDVIHSVYSEVQMIMLSAVHHCMELAYEDMLDMLRNYDKNSIKSLHDCVEVIDRFWFTVFSEFFGKANKLDSSMCDVPENIDELRKFVEFWSTVLKTLYEKTMSSSQNKALGVLISRWTQVTGE